MPLLQHDPDKTRRYRALAPFSAPSPGAQIAVVDSGLIEAILRSDKFGAIDAAAGYRSVAESTGLDFSAIVSALDHAPLVKEGQEHRALREEIAGIFGAKLKAIERDLRPAIPALIDQVFREGATVDLVLDFAYPIYLASFSTLLGVDHGQVEQGPDISLIFDQQMSLNRRKKLNESLNRSIESLRSKGHGLAASPEIALALTILGKDSLVGTISSSLYEEIVANPGVPLSQIPYAKMPPTTGVPYVDRVALQDVTLGALSVAAGQKLRLYLDATTRQTFGADAGLLFGKGRHLCLGRPVFLMIWSLVTENFARCGLTATPLAMQPRRGDDVFFYPEHAYVRLGR